MTEMIRAHKILVRKPERKRPFWRKGCTSRDNIKLDLTGRVCQGVDWIKVLQDRDQWRALANKAMNFRDPKAWNCLISLATISFSKRTLINEVNRWTQRDDKE
jgi:hypothetical protein